MNRISLCPRILKWVFMVMFLLVISGKVNGQFYAVKVDAIGLMTGTFNVEGAMVVSNHWSLQLPVKVNPWTFGDKYYKRLAVLPGARYWLINSYSRGLFVGVNAVYTMYNHDGMMGNKIDYFGRDFRYKGSAYGGGVSLGYSIPVGRRWNIEFEAGVAGVKADHDIYYMAEDGMKIGNQKGFLPIPNKIGAHIVYLF